MRAWSAGGLAVAAALGAALATSAIAQAPGQKADPLERGGTQLWCNARSTAAGFYRALGFEAKGEEFELPGIGAHSLMWRPLGPAR